MPTTPTTSRRPAGRRLATLLAAAGLVLVTGCSAGAAADAPDGGSGETRSQVNAWGTAELPAEPTRVAVVSAGDRAIAYQLGITPVIEWDYPAEEPAAYVGEKRAELGISDPVTYDGTDGTDVEAIAAADPDVILGMNSYSMADDYEQLSKIAPVVTFAEPDDDVDLSWQERLERAAEGLGTEDEAAAVESTNAQVVTDAKAAHPELAGKSYTYLIVHPEQLTYASYADASANPVDDLGLTRPAAAAGFSAAADSVSLENLDQVDADVLMVAYPFGDEGLVSRADLEANPLWQAIPAVQQGRWFVVDADSGLASDLAYPDALSYPWVIEELATPLAEAAAGRGGA